MEQGASAFPTHDWTREFPCAVRIRPACAFVPALLALLLLTAPGRAEEYFQYLPSPVETHAPPIPEGGILTKRVLIRPGDTLSAISRRYSGKAFYYPQILLFNRIPDPNRIYAGKEILVPLSLPAHRRGPSPAASPLNQREEGPPHSGGTKYQTPGSDKGTRPLSGEARLYRQSVAWMDRGDCQRALRGFSLFLKKYPDSTLAPDVRLHRADCYLRLSGTPDTRDLPR